MSGRRRNLDLEKEEPNLLPRRRPGPWRGWNELTKHILRCVIMICVITVLIILAIVITKSSSSKNTPNMLHSPTNASNLMFLFSNTTITLTPNNAMAMARQKRQSPVDPGQTKSTFTKAELNKTDLKAPCFNDLAQEGPHNKYAVINYVPGTSKSVRLTTCVYLNCGNHNHHRLHRHRLAYLCVDGRCGSWGWVFQYSTDDYTPLCGRGCFDLERYITITEADNAVPHGFVLTISGLWYNSLIPVRSCPSDRLPKRRLILNWGTEDPRGGGKAGIIINFINKTELDIPNVLTDPALDPNQAEVPSAIEIEGTPAEKLLQFIAGQAGDNLWLHWLVRQSQEVMNGTCIACAAARPIPTTVPVSLLWDIDPQGAQCYLNMFKNKTTFHCQPLHNLFPALSRVPEPPFFKLEPHNYSCVARTVVEAAFSGERSKTAVNVGHLPDSWCITTLTTAYKLKNLVIPRADLYWLCQSKLLIVLPPKWYGTCALVRLAVPVYLLGELNHRSVSAFINLRAKRSVARFTDPINNPTYIDAIGVPRGVPSEHKLANEFWDGWSSLVPQVVINKNVARINYINYNVMRLTNFTIDAIEGLSSQLKATSTMALQNRMALDMLLAKEGGVCSMFGSSCCVSIPDNVGSGGRVEQALNGLKSLRDEMQENSGTDDWILKWLENFFGRWKAVIISVIVVILVILILVICGPICCFPCFQCLCTRCMMSVFAKPKVQQMLVQTFVSYHNPPVPDEEIHMSPGEVVIDPPTPDFGVEIPFILKSNSEVTEYHFV